MAKITYTNKVALNENPEIALINKVTDDDLNQIKSVVNTNDDNVGDLTTLTTTTKTSTVEAINELQSNKAENDIVEISNTQPSSTSNKIWIDTGAVGSAVSEITNEYSTSTGLGYSANYINNLLYIGYVDIEISKAADSEANLTMTVPTGYRFLTWYGCITLGWVGSVYIENMLAQTTKIHNNITKGTGNGWTRNYYLCVKGS